MSEDKYLIIYDSFCGWCFAASPVFDALVESGAEVEMYHRHLFQGANEVHMGAGMGAQIMQMIPRIEEISGQTFGDAFKTNIAMSSTEVVESGLSAQAAALVHGQGAAKENALRGRIETLHFEHGMSALDRDTIVAAAIAEGVAPDRAARIGTPELAAEAAALAAKADDLMTMVGARGVPTVLRVRKGQVSAFDHHVYFRRTDALAANIQPKAAQ